MKEDGFKTNYNISDVIFTRRYMTEPWAVEYEMMTEKERELHMLKRWGDLRKQNKHNLMPPFTADDMDKKH